MFEVIGFDGLWDVMFWYEDCNVMVTCTVGAMVVRAGGFRETNVFIGFIRGMMVFLWGEVKYGKVLWNSVF